MTLAEFRELLEQALTFYNSEHSSTEIDAGITGGLGAVRYDAAQTLAEMQKAQARRNIGAGSGDFAILGKYETLEALSAAVTNPAIGDNYAVGAAAPYNIYSWTGSGWFDNGPIASGLWGDISGNISDQADLAAALAAKEDKLSFNPGMVNPNILHNWYFVGGGSQQGGGQFPVNQRGQTSYGVGYGIDRWRATAQPAVNVNDDSISLGTTGTAAYFFQRIENPIKATYTASVLVRNPNNASGRLSLRSTNETTVLFTQVLFEKSTNFKLYTLTITVDPAEYDGTLSFMLTNPSAASYDILAAKLELGDTQTLAHLENGVWVLNEIPDYGEELAKCQRYYQRFNCISSYFIISGNGVIGTNTTSTRMAFPLAVPMRADPSITFSDVYVYAVVDGVEADFKISGVSWAQMRNSSVKIAFNTETAASALTPVIGIRNRSETTAYFALSADL